MNDFVNMLLNWEPGCRLAGSICLNHAFLREKKDKWYYMFWYCLNYSIVITVGDVGRCGQVEGGGWKNKKMQLPGFEPGASRVWSERDNQLHHRCLSLILRQPPIYPPFSISPLTIWNITGYHLIFNGTQLRVKRLLPGLPQSQRLLLLVQYPPNRHCRRPHRPPLPRVFLLSHHPRNRHRLHGCPRLVLPSLCRLLRYFSEGAKTFAEKWDNRVNVVILVVLMVSIGSDVIAP